MLRLLEKIALLPYTFENDMALESKGMVNIFFLIHVKYNKVEVTGKINKTSTTRLQTTTM